MRSTRRAGNTLRTLSTVVRHPGSAKFLPSWVISFLPAHNPIEDQVPWMSFEGVAWLKSYLKPGMVVFEYGSGGSTLFLARRVGRLISVEHDRDWYRRVSEVIEKEGISNCRYQLCEPEGEDWERYVGTLDEYDDGSLDLVIVDGRARPACMSRAVAKIRPGGYLLLDDSEREGYRSAMSLLEMYSRKEFSGLCPYTILRSQTTVWRIT